MSLFSIRQAQVSDARQLSEMICENAQALLRPHYNRAQWDIFIRYYSVEVLGQKIAQQQVFCAQDSGMIVGTVALDGDLVVGFYTRLQHVGQGIGKRLMDHVEAHAAAQGLRSLQLAASPEGLAFYLKNGWQKIKDVTVTHYGVGFEETLMTKNLDGISATDTAGLWS